MTTRSEYVPSRLCRRSHSLNSSPVNENANDRESLEQVGAVRGRVELGGQIHASHMPHLVAPPLPQETMSDIVDFALAGNVVKEGESARQAYLNFLKLGGSKFPLDELLEAGVDMRSSDPIEQAIAHFAQLVDQLIEMHGS